MDVVLTSFLSSVCVVVWWRFCGGGVFVVVFL